MQTPKKIALPASRLAPFPVVHTKILGDPGADANSSSHPHCNHQHLDGKGQGQGMHRLVRSLSDGADKIAVHNVVKGLNYHG